MKYDEKHAYEVEIEIPGTLHGADLEHFIEHLREQAHPKLIVRVPADSKADAAAKLADSTESYGYGPRFDRAAWHKGLRIIRSKEARRRAGDSFGGDQELEA